MAWLDRLHARHHHTRRLRVLGRHLGALLPTGASVLDVGCGDGLLTRTLAEQRDLRARGTDVLVRPGAHVPVTPFDGRRLPFDDRAFDWVLLVDVVHHAEDPAALLAEATRVCGRGLVVKDHLLQGLLAGPTLRFMDRVSNLRHGVRLPYHYWTPAEWTRALRGLGLRAEAWQTRLALYPFPTSLVFERRLHFVARLRRDASAPV
jgi:SAM-dependent methyltransferase